MQEGPIGTKIKLTKQSWHQEPYILRKAQIWWLTDTWQNVVLSTWNNKLRIHQCRCNKIHVIMIFKYNWINIFSLAYLVIRLWKTDTPPFPEFCHAGWEDILILWPEFNTAYKKCVSLNYHEILHFLLPPHFQHATI